MLLLLLLLLERCGVFVRKMLEAARVEVHRRGRRKGEGGREAVQDITACVHGHHRVEPVGRLLLQEGLDVLHTAAVTVVHIPPPLRCAHGHGEVAQAEALVAEPAYQSVNQSASQSACLPAWAEQCITLRFVVRRCWVTCLWQWQRRTHAVITGMPADGCGMHPGEGGAW